MLATPAVTADASVENEATICHLNEFQTWDEVFESHVDPGLSFPS